MRFGIIGTNFISDAFANALAPADACATAVYSRKKETGRAFAEKHGISHVFDDMEAFLSSPLFDAVYVASPNFLHEAQSIAALNHGKHVLCEKPIAPSLSGFRRMQAVAQEKGLVLMEAMRPYHDSLWDVAKNEMLPLLDGIRKATLSFCQYSSRYDKFLAGEYTNTFDPALSNAALLDIGIYPVAAAVMIFGEPRAVSAESVFLANGFEGEGRLLLDYGDTAVTVIYSKIRNDGAPSVFENGDYKVTVNKISQPARVAFLHKEKEEFALSSRHGGEFNNMSEEVMDFSHAVKKKDLTPYHAESAMALRICDEARRQTGIRFPSDEEAPV